MTYVIQNSNVTKITDFVYIERNENFQHLKNHKWKITLNLFIFFPKNDE